MRFQGRGGFCDAAGVEPGFSSDVLKLGQREAVGVGSPDRASFTPVGRLLRRQLEDALDVVVGISLLAHGALILQRRAPRIEPELRAWLAAS
jgi:hypothetical protein